jgi:hypothetical protein
MIRGMLAATTLMALAACVSSDDASAPAPPPQAADPAPAQAPQSDVAATGVVAPDVQAPPAPAPPPPPGDIVVPGQVERAVPPIGDPRSVGERAADVRAWDDCVVRAQGVAESDPMRPQMDTPEEACSRALGMANRTAVPESRRR